MFLVNSCLGLFTAASFEAPLLPKLRGQFAEFLTTLLPLALGSSPHLPVSVCGTGTLAYTGAFLTHINAALHLRSDTGERAEVYFVNSKDLTLNWGTTQRIMIPTPEVPSGIPVGMNGNMVIYFRDYLAFISKVAGIRDTYSLSDVSEARQALRQTTVTAGMWA